jgi:hypothetical protein
MCIGAASKNARPVPEYGDRYMLDIDGYMKDLKKNRQLKPVVNTGRWITYHMVKPDNTKANKTLKKLYRQTWGVDISKEKYDHILETTASSAKVYSQRNLLDKDMPMFTRKCHDCGTGTNEYRCALCTAKWREKEGVVEDVDDSDW